MSLRLPKFATLGAFDKGTRSERSTAESQGRSWRLAEWEIGIVFVALYLLMERLSYVHPLQPGGVTPWNPQVGLVIAFVLLRGVRALPALALALLASEVFARTSPAPFSLMLLGSTIMTVGYGGAAFALGRCFETRTRIVNLADLAWLLVIAAIAPLVIGAAHIAASVLFGDLVWGVFLQALVSYWVGDVVGILAVLPLALVLAEPELRGRLWRTIWRWETALQFGCAAAILVSVYFSPPGSPIKYFFTLFLPLIWIAARHGLIGAAAMLTFIQFGLIVAVQLGDTAGHALIELQARMIALSVTGLLLGIVVDERERAQECLQQSLRLAAAGEMAAALAHEVNQPLSALVSYGRACQHMVSQPNANNEQLAATVNKLAEQAQRLSDIVKRLRDFLRSGTMNLEPVELGRYLERIVRPFDEAARHENVSIKLSVAGPLPAVLIDRMEIEIVLRNLIANAIDSIREARPYRREIQVHAQLD
jgi:signal transduction histidine kinase